MKKALLKFLSTSLILILRLFLILWILKDIEWSRRRVKTLINFDLLIILLFSALFTGLAKTYDILQELCLGFLPVKIIDTRQSRVKNSLKNPKNPCTKF